MRQINPNGVTTSCLVKHSSKEDWKHLEKKSDGELIGFLRLTSDLQEMPPTEVKCAIGIEDVYKQFMSEEGHIK